MNDIGIAFTVFASAMLLMLPRRLAAMPLLLGATYMTAGQVLAIGPAHFTVIRILVAVGLFRMFLRNEHLAHGIQPLDRLLVWWSVILLCTGAFHMNGTLLYRFGLVWTELGCYILLRAFLVDADDVRRLFAFVCASLVPIALLMLIEKSTGKNPFGELGGVNEFASLRYGQIRASGPFVHPILAGTVGAICLGMALYLAVFRGRFGHIGILAGIAMLYACSSSGPDLMAIAIVLGLLAWPLRMHLAGIRWLAIVAMVVLQAVMHDPFYFVMAKIDITGGSQSWHRAALIRSAIEHLDEWWLVGTDHTRHWMPTGIHANAFHTDITNHILMMGVMGGLPLMLIFVLILRTAFRSVGSSLRSHSASPTSTQVLIWTLGVMLFGLFVDFFGISLFDQSIVFLYLVLAAIGAFSMPQEYPTAVFQASLVGRTATGTH